MKKTSNSPTHVIKQALVSGNVPGANNLRGGTFSSIYTVFISQNTNVCVCKFLRRKSKACTSLQDSVNDGLKLDCIIQAE